jgi:hypothetical protein
MPRDRRLNATEVEAILRRYSFTLISQGVIANGGMQTRNYKSLSPITRDAISPLERYETS